MFNDTSMKKPARLFWNPAHQRLGATCRRRAPAPPQDCVQVSASLQPWTPSWTKRVEHRSCCALFCFSFPSLIRHLLMLWRSFPMKVECITASLPPCYLWKAMIRNRCSSLGFSSCTLFDLQLFTLAFLLFPNNPNPRDFNNISDNYSQCKLLPKLSLCVSSLLILTETACLAGSSVLLAYFCWPVFCQSIRNQGPLLQ